MKIVKECDTPFYLTGGTALSRFYYNHRYSDDLDLFMNNDANFNTYFSTILAEFEKYEKVNKLKINRTSIRKEFDFAQVFLSIPENEDIVLKIDFVNDIEVRFCEIIENPVIKLDSWQNILSNKIAALFRFAPKDVADIWVMSKNQKFNWKELMDQAKQKEGGIDEIEASKIIGTFPIQKINEIKWAIPVDSSNFEKELQIISKDMLFGRDNTLSRLNKL